MVFFSTRLAVCVVWLGQGYWMIRHIRNVIITSFSLCLYGCGYSLLTEDSLINTLTLHVLMIGSSHWTHLRHYLGHLSCMPRFNHSWWSYTGLPSLSGQTSPPESPPLQCGCLWAWWGEVLDVPRSLPRWGRASWPGPAWSVGTVGTCAWFHLPHSVSLGAGVLSPCFQISWPR